MSQQQPNQDKSWGMADLIFATERSKNVPRSVRIQASLVCLGFAAIVVFLCYIYESEQAAKRKALNEFREGIRNAREQMYDATKKAISDLDKVR